MHLRQVIPLSVAVFSLTASFAFQAGFRRFAEEEDNPAPLPDGYNERTEWAFGRLRYGSGRYAGYWGRRGTWPTDFPKADRQFIQGVRRLTRLNARTAEQVIELNDDEIFNWPWLYAVEVGHWDLSQDESRRMREYLLRGGFFMCDDFHGSREWEVF